MRIYGLSQSSGVERRLHIERAGEGIVLILSDHVGNLERERILVPQDRLTAAVLNPVPGGSTIEGKFPPNGPKKLLEVEIRRNEVLLTVSGESGNRCDVAVGWDDFQDALEKTIG